MAQCAYSALNTWHLGCKINQNIDQLCNIQITKAEPLIKEKHLTKQDHRGLQCCRDALAFFFARTPTNVTNK